MDRMDLLKGQARAALRSRLRLLPRHAGPRDIGIVGFLIETDGGERLLVDGGFPAKYAGDPAGATAEDDLGSFGEVLSITPANRPAAQIALTGAGPEDVDLLLLTHSHIDHVGALHDFPRAPLVVAEAERALPARFTGPAASPSPGPTARPSGSPGTPASARGSRCSRPPVTRPASSR
jgi:N-acyl homoserine lactone hydrolase